MPIEQTGAGWRYESIDMDVVFDPEERSMSISGSARLRLQIESSLGPTLMLRRNDGESDESEILFTSLSSERGETAFLNMAFAPKPGVILAGIRAWEPFTHGDVIDVTFEIAARGMRQQFVIHPKYATSSWTSAWYPVPAPGQGEAYGAGLMLARGTVRFTMPEEWQSVSVGDLVSRSIEHGQATDEWQIDEPRAIGFAAGPFQSSTTTVGDKSIGMYRLTAEEGSLPHQAQALADVIDAMSQKFGSYPYTRFSIAEAPDPVPGFWAASEQGFILAKPGVFTEDGGNIALFAHEAAHAWWGNLVGTDGNGGIFLTESICQYGAYIAIHENEGEEAATDFLRFSRPEYIEHQSANGYFQIIRNGDDRPISSIERGGGINHQIADSKGHWVHHMLRRRMGDEAYFGVLNEVVSEFVGGNVTLEEFRARCIDASPDARLETFFAQWLDRAGAPVIDMTWERVDSGGIEVTLTQSQAGETFDLDIELDIVGAAGVETRAVSLIERERTFTLPSESHVDDVLLDPRHRILRWTPEYGARPVADE
jgi:hypothetical protein